MGIFTITRGDATMKNITFVILLTIFIMIILYAFMGAVSQTADNQSVMLCKSALKSGNEEWLNRCDTFYKTNNPLDIKQ